MNPLIRILSTMRASAWKSLFFAGLLSLGASVWAEPEASVRAQVQIQKQPLLATLRDLVSSESGSVDREGLYAISQLIHDRFRALGAQMEFIEAPANTYRMHDTPCQIGHMVKATFNETGTKNDFAHRPHGHVVPQGHGRQAAVSHGRQ